MEQVQSTIRAFRNILPNWRFDEPSNWAEEFAIKRFLKKMEIPDSSKQTDRRTQCWDRWLRVDGNLPPIHLPSSEWYRARQLIHEWCRDWRLGPTEFSTGSEFKPTVGRNSIEAKLCSSLWTCTHDNFGNFAKVCYRHKALKRAAKIRFATLIRRKGLDARAVNRYLYRRMAGQLDVPFSCFKAKLRVITEFTYGSRFSTVPKNNDKDRPINIEPFANILVQKKVGSGLRDVINKVALTELDLLPDLHKDRISDLSNATIDLSDASDSISVELVRFLLPARIFEYLESCRSGMVLGLDGSYHVTKKISSMGNGFTFELMTLILTALCRVLDENSSVFGDDIIINRDKASRLISLLNEVGFDVNVEKSFVDGSFRESCGGNFHRDFGYIKSFDFKYPESIHDCVVLYNKVHALARDGSYKNFVKLESSLRRTIPPALRGVWTIQDSIEMDGPVPGTSSFLSGYFKCPKEKRGSFAVRIDATKWLADHQHGEITSTFWAFKFNQKLRTSSRRDLTRRNWAKYEMYLHSGRVAKDVITGEGVWTRKLMCMVDGEWPIEAKRITNHV